MECKELPKRRMALQCDIVGENAGRFDALRSEAFGTSPCELELDISGVQQVDSRGLSLLIGLSQDLRRAGGRLILANPHPDIAELLGQMRLLGEEFQARSPETG